MVKEKQCDSKLAHYRCINSDGHKGMHHSFGVGTDRQVILWGSFQRERETHHGV